MPWPLVPPRGRVFDPDEVIHGGDIWRGVWLTYTLEPAGFISITSCGATPNDGSNDSPAIQTCINNARSQGQGVWIPAGTFNSTSASLDANGATIRGAGMWHSTQAFALTALRWRTSAWQVTQRLS